MAELGSFKMYDIDLTFNVTQGHDVMVRLDSPYYGFLLKFTSIMWPNLALLQDLSLQNLSDLEFYLSRSLKGYLMVSLKSPYLGYY